MNRANVRAVEYLRVFVSDIIERFSEGALNGAEAQLMIWDEIAKTVSSMKPKHFDNVLWLRVVVPEGHYENQRMVVELVKNQAQVLSVRFAGPRTDPKTGEEYPDGVLYIAALTSGIFKATGIVYALSKEGYNIRDWTFGCHKR